MANPAKSQGGPLTIVITFMMFCLCLSMQSTFLLPWPLKRWQAIPPREWCDRMPNEGTRQLSCHRVILLSNNVVQVLTRASVTQRYSISGQGGLLSMIGNAVQLAGTTCTVSALFKATERCRERSSPVVCLKVSGLCLQLSQWDYWNPDSSTTYNPEFGVKIS